MKRPGVLIAAALIGAPMAGCGSSSNQRTVSVGGTTRPDRVEVTAVGPGLLAGRHRLPAEDAAFVTHVPSEVRPDPGSVVRVPAPPRMIGRYWLAPWREPRDSAAAFCLYSAGPGDAGPSAQCFDARLYREARAYALSVWAGHVELVGFNPDSAGSAALRYAHRTVRLRVRRNVFVALITGRPKALEVTTFDRHLLLPVRTPADVG